MYKGSLDITAALMSLSFAITPMAQLPRYKAGTAVK